MNTAKRLPLFALILTGLAWACRAETDVYVNRHIGFDVAGYNYQQKEYPCDIDRRLIEHLIEQGPGQQIRYIATDGRDDIYNKGIPVLAIDINALVLNKEHVYGTRAHSHLPRVKITSVLIEKKRFAEGYVQAQQRCAIATLNELTPSSSVLDLGVNSTICGAVDKCLLDLSEEVTDWVSTELKP